MYRFMITAFAAVSSAMAFGLTFQTGFEKSPTEAPGWDPLGLTNSWAANGFSGNVNSTPGFGFVKNTGTVIGAQAAQVDTQTTNSTTDYVATKAFPLGSSNKRGFSMVKLLDLTMTNGRGIGLKMGSWRLFVMKDSTSTTTGYSLYYSNAKTFLTSQVAANVAAPTQFRSLDFQVDVSSIAPNAAFAKAHYAGVAYTLTTFTASSTDSVTSAELLSRGQSSSRGSGRFDNFYMTDVAVPETGSLLALAAGAGALISRRRH